MKKWGMPLIVVVVFILGTGIVAWRYGYLPMPADRAKSGEPLVELTVPPLLGAAREGEAIYNAKCASCHGKNAAGQHGVAPPLVHVIYRPDHHSDMAFELAARNGVRAHHWPYGDMPPVKGIPDGDMIKIISYVRSLQRANDIF